MLDSSKAYNKLKWKPVWGIDLTINNTIDADLDTLALKYSYAF